MLFRPFMWSMVVTLGFAVTGNAQTVTPRVIISEEEEPLLGIPEDSKPITPIAAPTPAASATDLPQVSVQPVDGPQQRSADIEQLRHQRQAHRISVPKQRFGSNVERLLQIANETEAAGLNEEASSLRELAKRIQERSRKELTEKQTRAEELEAELRSLRTEIAALQGSGYEPQVLVQVKILQIEREELAQLAEEWEEFRENALPRQEVAEGKREALLAHLNHLIKAKRIKVLSEPQMITTVGREAQLHVGGEFAVPTQRDGQLTIEFRPFGTCLTATPTQLENGRWQLDLMLKQSERDFASIVQVGGIDVPGLTTSQFCGGAELDADDAVVLVHPLPRHFAEPTPAAKAGVKHELKESFHVVVLTVDPFLGETATSPPLPRPLPHPVPNPLPTY